MKGEEKMNQTTNYNFNVPVGSDIVNPLVQDFPNWESLDSILRNVANTGITTATHTKTGTIHTLTFSETTVPMIRFQATADFNTNDTFTVNGVSVSALTVAGESLPDGAFVIGSMVLCELRDNLLTVYSSGSDASTLEGHPASYFATDSDLQTVDGKADANKTLIDNLTAALTNWIDITNLCSWNANVTTRYAVYNPATKKVVIKAIGSSMASGATVVTLPVNYRVSDNTTNYDAGYYSTSNARIPLAVNHLTTGETQIAFATAIVADFHLQASYIVNTQVTI